MVWQNVLQALRWKAVKICKWKNNLHTKSILTCLFSPFTLKITRMKTLQRSVVVSSKDDFSKEACSLYAVYNCWKNKRINQSKHENHFVMYNSFSLLFNYSVIIGQQVDLLHIPVWCVCLCCDQVFFPGILIS